MRTLIWGKTFKRAFKRTIKKHPDLKEGIEETLKTLTKDPFVPRLETHKLKGELSGSWACSAGYNLRVVFDFVKSQHQKEDDILLIEIGTHEEVY
ncbi:type II toxin-antitoxin system mRNA interferase toxin, RelE/StbE family [bacterium]|nr:type II toxin-antitoxin system mRNA interferase toxin, RelE/StbE family [bacterium]MCK4436628.1 type II toxin-antitoxin system mRNA interferase toxin, RelE/StbE family [bacterium]